MVQNKTSLRFKIVCAGEGTTRMRGQTTNVNHSVQVGGYLLPGKGPYISPLAPRSVSYTIHLVTVHLQICVFKELCRCVLNE